jgi:hypothetical protein
VESKNEVRKKIVINTVERKPYWKIEAQSLVDLLDKNVKSELQPTNLLTFEDEDLEIDI